MSVFERERVKYFSARVKKEMLGRFFVTEIKKRELENNVDNSKNFSLEFDDFSR